MTNLTTLEMITCLKDLNKVNPNKFSLTERVALTSIRVQSNHAYSWLKAFDKESLRPKTTPTLEIFKQISSVTQDLEETYLLRPVGGRFVKQCRKMNSWRLDQAEKTLAFLINT